MTWFVAVRVVERDVGKDAEHDQGRRGPGAAATPRRKSGELSALVLDVLRTAARTGARAGSLALTPGEVQQRLTQAGVESESGALAYTTVVTILSRLHAQGLVERFRIGRAYAYRAISDPAELTARRMRRVLDTETDGGTDRDAALASFVGALSRRDERLLRDLLGPRVERDR